MGETWIRNFAGTAFTTRLEPAPLARWPSSWNFASKNARGDFIFLDAVRLACADGACPVRQLLRIRRGRSIRLLYRNLHARHRTCRSLSGKSHARLTRERIKDCRNISMRNELCVMFKQYLNQRQKRKGAEPDYSAPAQHAENRL